MWVRWCRINVNSYRRFVMGIYVWVGYGFGSNWLHGDADCVGVIMSMVAHRIGGFWGKLSTFLHWIWGWSNIIISSPSCVSGLFVPRLIFGNSFITGLRRFIAWFFMYMILDLGKGDCICYGTVTDVMPADKCYWFCFVFSFQPSYGIVIGYK